MGWGGGWLFAYSGKGFHMDFAPYFETTAQKVKAAGTSGAGIDLSTNKQTTAPLMDTSRARSLTLKVLCKQLPPTDQSNTGCDVNDLATIYPTILTTQADGKWTDSWSKAFSPAKQVYLLNPDGWQYLQGLANQPNTPNAASRPFQLPTFTVAGYWYAQSPNTINNCNNCYATGTSTVVGDPNAAYLLPVNMDESGKAALDANGNPIFVRDSDGNVVMENGKPKIEGEPIDLTLVIEKYLDYLGTVNKDNLPPNRIGLVSNDGTQSITLPDFTATLGFPVMQPLCGTIGKAEDSALACPQ